MAEEAGSPQAYRAVGVALAKNPIPIIIPCHGVLRKDGTLGGYGGGLDMKKRLLEMEARTAYLWGLRRGQVSFPISTMWLPSSSRTSST